MIQGTLSKVQDGSVGPPNGPERVGRPSQRSGTGWGNLPEVLDGSGDPQGGPVRVGGPLGRSGTGQENL